MQQRVVLRRVRVVKVEAEGAAGEANVEREGLV